MGYEQAFSMTARFLPTLAIVIFAPFAESSRGGGHV
jgi:hypothetical protein